MNFLRILMVCWLAFFASNSPVQADPTLPDLLQQGQKNLAAGYFREARNQFQQAESIALEQQDNYSVTLIRGLQGYIALQHQDYELAEQILTAVLTQAEQNNWTDLQMRFALYLGQLQQRKQNMAQARVFFEQALLYSDKITDKSLKVSSLYQLASINIDDNETLPARKQLQQAKKLLETLPVDAVSSQLWLNIGFQTLRLVHPQSKQQDDTLAALYALRKAAIQAEQFKQLRIQASALKYLGELYTPQSPNEAIKLLLAGINLAQKADAADLLIDLEWKIGQLYQAQHNDLQAINAYRRAVKHIESIRIDIPVSYDQGRSSFRDTFAPIYLALADLLLTQTHAVSPSQQQVLLKEAQDTVEVMKKSELEDYFQSRCDISATPINLQKSNNQNVAAIYPIALPNRLEIIVYTAQGLQQFTSPVTAVELERQARLFSKNLRDYAEFSESKKQATLLYQWLIAPLKPLLEKQQIQTLLYIPDGGLRLVPLAALYDGKKFVIEDYAVVTSPGMSLIDNSNNKHSQRNILLAGMSIPGDVINDLPAALLDDLVTLTPETGNETRKLTRGIQRSIKTEKRKLTASEREQKNWQLREMLKKPVVMEKLQKLLALPGVDAEITGLAEQNNSPYLLNESFSLANFKHALTDESHKILHIASHGFFGSTAEESFIMTYDRILNLNQLESLLNSDYFKLHPIDLITLSACQTAEGDDRSPLGISGVAIKSKVHSALGSLWPVSDDATSQLMTDFYHNLTLPEQNKAQALQAAEIKLLKQTEFNNPSFWSPFVLVGNWL